jgi:indolepyruvate ferredoxin oxidoreductase alpha subunit
MERKQKRMKIKPVLETLGVERMWDVDAYNVKGIQDAMAESFNNEGFSVIIARHPCMLKFTRERRRREAAKQAAAGGEK